MTTILSFDTSADFCAAALVRAETAFACDSLPMSRGHAEALVPLVQELCAEAGIELSGVDLIGVTVGPGSFTGVRTGIAAAKGFALAAGCPAIGVSSLDAVALGAKDQAESPILVLLDTRRSDYFVQLFNADAAPLEEPSVRDADGVRDLVRAHHPVVTGNAVDRFFERVEGLDPGSCTIHAGPGVPHPMDVADIAERILNTRGVASDTLSPLYLRAPEAKVPPGGGRLKY
jgi:tRNA threonylcarbamoyladenosine biosynthesis protein TsaB